MPPRISRASTVPKTKTPKPRVSAKKAKSAKKTQSRSLNAFAIASHEYPDEIKVRRNRLGESDVGPSHRKRQRDEDEDSEEEDEDEGRRKQKRVEKGRFDELDIDEGSDSEGNTWTMGHVDEDDDEDIDSDEAFGESDEERFEGWTFRGSASNQMKQKPKKRVKDVQHGDDDIDLDESDSAGEDSDDESLGEDAVDLATMLDQYEESDEDQKPKNSRKQKAQESDDEDEPSEEGYSDDDGASDFSMSDGEDNDPSKIAQLKKLISSLPAEEEVRSKGPRGPEVHESGAPSEFGVFRKVDLLSLKPKITDPEKKKALKLLQDDIKSSKRNSIARKLDAPLPKRQQDKLDRAAATEKANETLGRWVETVKTNRRAEHLSFPLKHANAGQSMGESKLMPTQMTKPANDLESTIQSILQESGLSTKDGKDDEENLQKWEELQTNKLPLEEVMARRAELRKQRELLFREEVRSKRIKKIKSKAYRRVHRRERERIAERERNALIADGVDLSEDEREYNDRRRAEERMGSKHRDSKWAKSMKKSGRTVWDDDARAGVTEMARRNEELRRRIEGKEIRDEDEDGSDFSSSDDDEEEDGNEVLKRQLGKLKENPFSMKSSKLGSMAFMQKADAARKARNDEAVEQLRRDLAGEESNSDVEDENAVRSGRRKFGPGAKLNMPDIPTNRNEFEEPAGSDEEDENGGNHDETTPKVLINGLSNGSRKSSAAKGKTTGRFDSAKEDVSLSENPYLKPARKSKEKADATVLENPFLQPASKSKPKATAAVSDNPFLQPANKSKEKASDSIWKAQDTITTLQEKPQAKSKSKESAGGEAIISAPDADGWQTVTYGDQDDEGDADLENEGIDLDIVMRNHELTAKGFAGDDVEAEFIAEKKAVIDEDDTKVIDATLPGWGCWTGSGLSKKAEARNKGKTLIKQEGIAADKRKDANLDRVIINEKKVKKNTRFLASSLPFPFENKEQYERSLRIPKGPEWTTKRTFQDGTKPRVLFKGGVIRPMSKPMV
jgi:U3 small nucleolar RNA-associated protein 14